MMNRGPNGLDLPASIAIREPHGHLPLKGGGRRAFSRAGWGSPASAAVLTPTRQLCFASEAMLPTSPFQGEVTLRRGRAKSNAPSSRHESHYL
jgi:hypothetical protein